MQYQFLGQEEVKCLTLWQVLQCTLVTIRRLLYTKEMTFKGKDGSTSILYILTNGSARMDSKDNVSGAGVCGSKGQPLTVMAEAGAKDTSSDSYRRSNKKGGR